MNNLLAYQCELYRKPVGEEEASNSEPHENLKYHSLTIEPLQEQDKLKAMALSFISVIIIIILYASIGGVFAFDQIGR